MGLNIENIKQIAENKKVSIQALAYKIGVTESGLHAMFKKGDMKVSTLRSIANELGEPMENFFTEETVIKGKEIVTSFQDSKVHYESALEKCNKELEVWKQKAYECMEKYNALLEQQIQQQNRQTG